MRRPTKLVNDQCTELSTAMIGNIYHFIIRIAEGCMTLNNGARFSVWMHTLLPWRKDMGREHVCHKSVSSFWRTNQRLEAQNNAFPNDFLTNTDARIYAVLARFQALILSNCRLGFIKSIHDILRDFSSFIYPKTTMKFAVYFTIFSCRRCNSRSLKFCRDLIT